MFFCWLPVNKMIGTYSRFIWCFKVFLSFINQCSPPFTFGFISWKSVLLQNLIARLYLQFVWVASIIITYFNTTTVLSNICFVSFWVFLLTTILLPFLLSVYKSFTFKLLRKNGMIRKLKVQLATHEKWWLKLGNHLLLSWYIPQILESLVSNILTAIKW